MLAKLQQLYREQGRQEVWSLFVEKFEQLHDEYYAQGDLVAADLVTDLVAWLQNDLEGINDKGI
jgi:hypothetical protein